MYLSEFLDSCDESFHDVSLKEGFLSSALLAKMAASYICELINRGFDVFVFIELIYYENALYEQLAGLEACRSSDEDISF